MRYVGSPLGLYTYQCLHEQAITVVILVVEIDLYERDAEQSDQFARIERVRSDERRLHTSK